MYYESINALIVRHTLCQLGNGISPLLLYGLVAQTNAYSFHLLSLFGTLYPPLHIPLPACILSSVPKFLFILGLWFILYSSCLSRYRYVSRDAILAIITEQKYNNLQSEFLRSVRHSVKLGRQQERA